jgi:hypothetical protein
MATPVPGDVDRTLAPSPPGGPSLWTRAGEVRAAVAQELARQGWSASVDVVGSTAPELELVVDAKDSDDRRRWKVAVTEAPVAAQVSEVLDPLRGGATRLAVRRTSSADRWCAPT